MSIRVKTFVIVGITAFIMIIGLYFFSNTILVQNFKVLESNEMLKNVEKIKTYFFKELVYVDTIATEWSNRDNFYEFLQKGIHDDDNDVSFITMENLKINLIYYNYNESNNIYYRFYDNKKNVELSISGEMNKLIQKINDKYNQIISKQSVKGLALINGQLMVLAVRQVPQNNQETQLKGQLIFGKLINNSYISELENNFGVKIFFQDKKDNDWDNNNLKFDSYGDVYLSYDNNKIYAFSELENIFDEKDIIVKITADRFFYKESLRTINLHNILFIFCILTLFGILVFLIQRIVISKLESINKFLNEARSSKDISRRIYVRGNDEISNLAENVSVMLQEIDFSNRELKINVERLKLVMEGSNDCFWDYNVINDYLFFSSKLFEILGYNENEFNNTFACWLKLIHEEDREDFESHFVDTLHGVNEIFKFEHRIRSKSNNWVWFLAKGKVVKRDESGMAVRMSGLLTDITKEKKAQQEILFLSYNDKLTGISNRAYFEKKVAELCEVGKYPFTIVLGDLNGLKITNDTFGHAEGDKLLCAAANVLKKVCRQQDTIARWGGDEFAIILVNSDEGDAAIICSKIRNICNNTEVGKIKLCISLGYATKRDFSQDINSVFKEAEDMMYRNKLLENSSARSAIIMHLEQSLAERSYETEEHTQRIKKLCVKLGKLIELPDDELDKLILLSMLHDIGKIGIPDSILGKPSKLSSEEWNVMKKHTEIGYRIAKSSHELSHIAEAILSHHEWYNGKGYPRGLKGEEIPRIARILTIVDAFDVMTNGRNYREAISEEAALQEIIRCSGTQFDPEYVEIFVKMIREMSKEELLSIK